MTMTIDTAPSGTTYTVKIVFHKARSLPVADVPSCSSDPYVSAEIRPADPPSSACSVTRPLSGLSLSPNSVQDRQRRESLSNAGGPAKPSTPQENLLRPPNRSRGSSFTGPPTGTSGSAPGVYEDPPLRFRSPTVQCTLNPEWQSEWIVAGVPSSALIEARVYDEDDNRHDDLLGTAYIPLGPLSEHYASECVSYRLHRRGADLLALGLKATLGMFDRDARGCATLAVSVRVLGRTQRNIGRIYTVNSHWWIHHSPLIGTLTDTTSPGQLGTATKREYYNFQANQLQLHGPVPLALRHRYYPFKSFVAPTFEAKGLRGMTIHHIMRRQHRRIYHFDQWTQYGVLPDPVGPESRHPSVSDPAVPSSCDTSTAATNADVDRPDPEPPRVATVAGPSFEMSRRFLDMCYWGDGARIFTYIINRNGMLRFTETGPEIALDLLSKHMMHADVDSYIAYSGEFFVRPYRPGSAAEPPAEDEDDVRGLLEEVPASQVDEPVHPALDRRRASTVCLPQPPLGPRTALGRMLLSNIERLGPAPGENMPEITRTLTGPESGRSSIDPRDYELVIDNESGTYRPSVELLPLLRRFLAANLKGLHITAISGMDPELKRWKEERRALRRERLAGLICVTDENDLDSLESSDEEGEEKKTPVGRSGKSFAFLSDPRAAAERKLRRRRSR